MRLTRRDRAALTLALCELRGSATSYGSAIEALKHHDGGDWPPYLPPLLADCESEMDDAIAETVGSREWYRQHYRNRDLLRARLALLLRALLRADAGDYGPLEWQCSRGLHRVMAWVNYDRATCRDCETAAHMHRAPRRITPLWELARETGR